jgi:hypothetical protein
MGNSKKGQQKKMRKPIPDQESRIEPIIPETSPDQKTFFDIKKKLEGRNQETLFGLKHSSSAKVAYRFVIIYMPIALVFVIISGLAALDNVRHLPFLITSMCGFLFSFSARYMLSAVIEIAPKKNPEADIWRWKKGRQFLVGLIICFVIAGFSIAFVYPYSRNWISLSVLFYILYLSMMLLVS